MEQHQRWSGGEALPRARVRSNPALQLARRILPYVVERELVYDRIRFDPLTPCISSRTPSPSAGCDGVSDVPAAALCHAVPCLAMLCHTTARRRRRRRRAFASIVRPMPLIRSGSARSASYGSLQMILNRFCYYDKFTRHGTGRPPHRMRCGGRVRHGVRCAACVPCVLLMRRDNMQLCNMATQTATMPHATLHPL